MAIGHSLGQVDAMALTLDDLQQSLGYRFQKPDWLQIALTHPSHRKARTGMVDFERLEFLGDAVLGLVVVDLLFHLYPNEREGALARRKSVLVSRESLVKAAEGWGIPEVLAVSSREAARGGAHQPTTVEDACEAVIGAIYLDGGIEPARQVVVPVWQQFAQEEVKPPKDPRTALQEWSQGRGLPLPEYQLRGQQGSAHQPEFLLQVSIPGHGMAEGRGANKKSAAAKAAEALLARLTSGKEPS
jgi:ribonuclease-3